MDVNEVSGAIVNAAMKVHSAVGPGLLESAYEACLLHELRKLRLKVETQVNLPVAYNGVKIDVGFRLDLLVEDAVIVELKAVETLLPIHEAQASLIPEAQWKAGRIVDQFQRAPSQRRYPAHGQQAVRFHSATLCALCGRILLAQQRALPLDYSTSARPASLQGPGVCIAGFGWLGVAFADE